MVSGSIVLYKTDIDIVSRCIHSFCGNSSERLLFLIDNSPTKDLESLVDLYPYQIVYRFNNKNIGYGAAHNIAIRESIQRGFQYHVVLNPDIEFGDETIDGLERFMNSNPDAGLAMPDIRDYTTGERRPCARLLPTPSNVFMRRFASNSEWTKRLNDRYQLKCADFSKVLAVPYLSGCFMFLRNDFLQDIGLFDDRFFMYFEDVDLSRRMFVAHENYYVPYVQAIHRGARESYHSKKMLWIMIKTAVKYFNKYGWFYDPERDDINKKVINNIC